MMQSTTFSINHLTEYRYHDAVSLAYNEAKLTPRSFENALVKQQCLDSRLTITPEPQDETSRQDYFGNQVTYFNFTRNHKTMSVSSSSLVTREVRVSKNEVTSYLKARLNQETWHNAKKQQTAEQTQLSLSSSLVPFFANVKNYAQPSFDKFEGLFDAVYDLMNRIYADFTFKPGVTTVTTPLTTVAKTMTGVCQDYSHFMIACVRSMGLACRYVSGYLETLPPPGQEKLQGVDASHAWLAVYIPTFGWLDFDPTNNLIALDQHITVAWGRDYADVPPLKGVVYSNGSHKLKVEVDMLRQDP